MIIERNNKIPVIIERRDIYKLAKGAVNYTQKNGAFLFKIKTCKNVHIVAVKPTNKFSDIFHILRRITSTSKQRY